MKKDKSTSLDLNALVLQLTYGPKDALVASDLSRLATISATISGKLASWLRGSGREPIDPHRTNFLIRSFLSAMRDEGWSPTEANALHRPLRFGLMTRDSFVEVVASIRPETQQFVHFDMADARRN